MIVVIDLDNVTIDGVPSGSVCDVLLNHDPRDERGFRSELLTALRAWSDGRVQEHHAECRAICESHAAEDEARETTHKDALAAKDAEHQAAIEQLKAEHLAAMDNLRSQTNEAIAKWESDSVSLRSANADLQSQVDALGGTELGQKLAREKRLAKLAEDRERLDAEISSLSRQAAS